MVTNIDARANARNHYHHQIIKYRFHDIQSDEPDITVVSPPGFSHMAQAGFQINVRLIITTIYENHNQSHKLTTAKRWLQDYMGPAIKAHDFELSEKYNTVVVTVTNAAFPAIATLSAEERQERAEKDELSTVELPVFMLDNIEASKKITEWDRSKSTPYADLEVDRKDYRVKVNQKSQTKNNVT